MKRSMWKEYRRFFIRLAVFLLLLYLPYALVLAGVAVVAVWFFAGKKRRTEEK